jgi:hypothetical protein
MQIQLDLGWTSEEGPSIPLEEARDELVRLMSAAIVVVSAAAKEADDDAPCASEDRP